MPLTLKQPRGANSGTSLTYNRAIGYGSLVVIVVVSNSATTPTITTGSNTLTKAVYTSGHNGDYTGIYYLPPSSNPGAQTTVSDTSATIYGLGYMEFGGAQWTSPLVNTSTGGNASTGTAATCTAPTGLAQAEVYMASYNVSNAGTAFTDNFPTGPLPVSFYGQSGWDPLVPVNPSFTLGSSGTYDICMATFLSAPSPAYLLQRRPWPTRKNYQTRANPGSPPVTTNPAPIVEQLKQWKTRRRRQISQPGGIPANNVTVYLPAGQVSVQGFVPTVQAGCLVILPVGQVNAAGPSPRAIVTSLPAPGQVAVAGHSVVPHPTVDLPAGRVTATAPSPALKTSLGLARGQVNVTGYSPTVMIGQIVNLPVGRVNVAGYPPTVHAGCLITLPAGRVNVAGPSPGIHTGMTLPRGVVNVSGYALSPRASIGLPAGRVAVSAPPPALKTSVGLAAGRVTTGGLTLAPRVTSPLLVGLVATTGYTLLPIVPAVPGSWQLPQRPIWKRRRRYQPYPPSPLPLDIGGNGAPGYIRVTYAQQTGFVFGYSGSLYTDANGNMAAPGLTGPVSIQKPVTGVTITETWESLGVGGSGSGVNGMFYRLTSENEVELVWDFAVSGVSGYIVATLPARYIPTVACGLDSGWNGTGPSGYSNIFDPYLIVSTNGAITARGTAGLTTINMFGWGKFTLGNL